MTPPDEEFFCPYVGLRPFTEAHRAFFFGRERDQRVIASNILAVPLTILYGESGVGKSSVLFAGVVPDLKERKDCAVAVFRDWQDKGFAGQLKRTCIAAVSCLDDADAHVGTFQSLALDDLLYQLGETSNKNIFVVFDQFEEYFFYHPGGPLSDAFESEFARAINREEVNVNFLIALREDSLHKLDRFRARIMNVLGNSLRLEQLDRTSAERAIRMPLEAYNRQFSAHVSIEDELVKEVLGQISARPLAAGFASDIGKSENPKTAPPAAIERIETPFLQLVMERLWEEEKDKSSVLRLDTFKRLGGAKEIARTHLERKLEKLQPDEKAVCVEFFDRLVAPSGTKVACRLDDLTQWAGNLAGRVPVILKHLEEGRILRRIDASSGAKEAPPLYEVFHDVLGMAILEWRKQYLKDREISEATRQAEEARSQAEVEKMRVEKERAKAAQDAAKFKKLSTALAIALVALVSAAVLILIVSRLSMEATQKAADATRNLSCRESLARAWGFLDSDPERSGILACDALKDAAEFPEIEKLASDVVSRALAASAVRLNFLSGKSPILAEAYSPKREILATVSEDGIVRLWDAKSASLLDAGPGSLWNPHRGPGRLRLPVGVASDTRAGFSTQGDLLVVVVAQGEKDEAYFWNVDSGCLLSQLPGVIAVAFSPDGRLVAAGTQSQSVQLFDTASWKLQRSIESNPDFGRMRNIAYGSAGKVAIGYQYGDITLLDPKTGKKITLIDPATGSVPHAHNATVLCVAFSPDGRQLGSASADGTAKLWDAKTGHLNRTLTGHVADVNFLEFSPNGEQVATCSQDRDARVWDAQTGALIHTLSGHANSVFKAIFSPSGKLIASVGADNSVRLWNAETGRFLFALKGHTPMQDAAYNAEGSTLFTLGRDGTVKAWSISSEHAGPVNMVVFSKTGKLATAGSDGTVKLWDPTSGEVLQTLAAHKQPVYGLAFAPDGTQLATASTDRSAKLWDADTGQEKARLQFPNSAPDPEVSDLDYHPKDENVLATAGLDGRVILWEGGIPTVLGVHEWQALHVAFSPDGSQLASAGSNGDAFIWDVKSRRQVVLKDPKLAKEKAHEQAIWRITFSPQGNYVMTCGADRTAKIWQAADGHLLKELLGHQDTVTDAEFDPKDGRTVVTASLDKGVMLWDVSSGKMLQQLTGHSAAVIAAIFDPTGTRIATASWDGTTEIWEKNVGEPLFNKVRILTSSGQVETVAFSPDGKRIAIGTSTGEVIVFPFDRGVLMNLANERFTRLARAKE